MLRLQVDIVLPPTMPLEEAHGIGESLQREIEKLEYVERGFVHLDVDTLHKESDEHGTWH